MQQAQQPAALQLTRQRRTVWLAWLVLVISFLLFCTLLAWSVYLSWNFYVTATQEQGAVLLVVPGSSPGSVEGVSWQPRNRAVFQGASDQQELKQGDHIRIATSAGYGKVATIRLFEQTTLDLWPKAHVRLDTLQTSRWNNRTQMVVLRQYDGYVRYDVPAAQQYQQVQYRVMVGNVTIDLAPGGSYSIDIKPPDRSILFVEEPKMTDIAVRSGVAEINAVGRTVKLLPGQRIEIDPVGMPGLTVPARWALIPDGDFNQHSDVEYNNTTIPDRPMLPRSHTWQVYGVPPDAGASGFFKIIQGCQPPNISTDCDARERRSEAWFIRSGGQTRPFTTGIYQDLGPDGQGVDISEYRSLVFSAWVRVINQSVELAGDQGAECPVMIRFWGKKNSPTDPEEQRVICVYTSDDPQAQPIRLPWVTYRYVERDTWLELRIELRDPDWLPDFRYLRSIQIYASGHDYDSRVTGVSLIGAQYRPAESGEQK